MADGDLRQNLRLEELADLREKTEVVTQSLQGHLNASLAPLRPLRGRRVILVICLGFKRKKDFHYMDVAIKGLKKKSKGAWVNFFERGMRKAPLLPSAPPP